MLSPSRLVLLGYVRGASDALGWQNQMQPGCDSPLSHCVHGEAMSISSCIVHITPNRYLKLHHQIQLWLFPS